MPIGQVGSQPQESELGGVTAEDDAYGSVHGGEVDIALSEIQRNAEALFGNSV